MPDENVNQNGTQRWINQQVEQRLVDLRAAHEILARDTRANNDALWKEFRDESRKTDIRISNFNILEERVKDLRIKVEEIEKKLHEEYMTINYFKPYRNGFLAIITSVGMAFLGGLIRLVIIPN